MIDKEMRASIMELIDSMIGIRGSSGLVSSIMSLSSSLENGARLISDAIDGMGTSISELADQVSNAVHAYSISKEEK